MLVIVAYSKSVRRLAKLVAINIEVICTVVRPISKDLPQQQESVISGKAETVTTTTALRKLELSI